jgi:hypothetical protein
LKAIGSPEELIMIKPVVDADADGVLVVLGLLDAVEGEGVLGFPRGTLGL